MEDLYDNIENYELNSWWFFYRYLMNAAEICADKEYIKRKYHPKEKRIKVNGTDDKAEIRVEVR